MELFSGELPPFGREESLLEPYLSGLANGELRVQRCLECDEVRFPPRRICPACGGFRSEWIAVSGRGTVWSVAVFYKAYFPDVEDRLPYNVAVVQLEEGPRLVSNIIGVPNDSITLGMPVTAEAIQRPGDAPHVVFHATSY